MKKLLFVLTAFLFIATTTQAQKSGMQWGVKIGPNFGSMTGDDTDVSGDEKKSMKFGYHFGPFVVFPLSGNLFLQVDLLYSAQGVVFKDGSDKYTLSTNHLNLPVMLRLQSPGGFYAIIGPQIGFTLGGKEKFDDGTNEDEDDLEDLRSVILSGVVGLGYKLPSGFGAYIRYAKGFSSVFDIEGYDSKAFHSTLSLSLFYMFGASKGAK